jgi:hypothetical protein
MAQDAVHRFEPRNPSPKAAYAVIKASDVMIGIDAGGSSRQALMVRPPPLGNCASDGAAY